MVDSARRTDVAALIANATARAWSSTIARDGAESALQEWVSAIAAAVGARRIELRLADHGEQKGRVVATATPTAAREEALVEVELTHEGAQLGTLVAEMPQHEGQQIAHALRDAADGMATLLAGDRLAQARRQSASARHDVDQLCRSLVELSNDLIQSVDRNGRILFANTTWKRTLGLEGISVEGRSIMEFLHADSLAHCGLAMQQVFAGAPLHRVSFAFRGPLGSKVSVEGDVMPRMQDGVVTATQGFFRRVFAPGESPAESAWRLHVHDEAFEGSPEALAYIGTDGLVQRVNCEFTRLFGYTNEEATARSIDQLVVPARLRNEGADLCRRAGVSEIINIETVRHAKGGEEIEVSLLATPIRVNGRQVAIQCIYRDIRDKKRLEAQLARSQRMEAIGRLAGGISHDFNNLLTVIQSTADMLIEELPKQSAAREEVHEIARAADRAAGLTRQLLAFSKRQTMAQVAMSLNECVDDVVRMLRRLIGEDIEVVTSLASGLGTTIADPSQIEQVLMNLAINARDAMHKGGKLTISTANAELDERDAQLLSLPVGSYVELRVDDTGTGIAPELLDRIFEPFFSTKSESGRGTGLGLSTVYGIVQQSHGAIEVKSELGKGSSFRVLLPRSDESKLQQVRAADALDVGRSETVLVVEDDHAIRALVERALAKAGYRVLAAESAAEAMDVAAQHDGAIELLFTDVVMPEGNGPELAQQLLKSRPSMRVLFTSGYADDKVFESTGTPKAAQFLAKPYSFAGLARKVREALDAK